MTQRLVVLGGLGDIYLVAALCEAFRHHHSGQEVVLAIKGIYAPLLALFPGVPYAIDDAAIAAAEALTAQSWRAEYDNTLWKGRDFYPHPCMARTPIKLDELPARWGVTHADMYRLILGLPLDAPLALPSVPSAEVVRGTVMIVQANTWPNTQPGFYPKLEAALRAAGREVWVNDRRLPLGDLLARAAATEWVIGPQCGLMSILVTGRWPCRKTLATPDIDYGAAPHYWAKSTFPYAYVSKFAGFDHDVEEFKIEADNHDELIALILGGSNASPSKRHEPGPVSTISMQLAPGDFLDRYAVLCVKRMRFDGTKRAAIERDYQRHREAAGPLLEISPARTLFEQLVTIHTKAFDILEKAVPEALEHGGMALEDHVAVIRANKARVRLRQQIDAELHAAFSEVKSYYGGE